MSTPLFVWVSFAGINVGRKARFITEAPPALAATPNLVLDAALGALRLEGALFFRSELGEPFAVESSPCELADALHPGARSWTVAELAANPASRPATGSAPTRTPRPPSDLLDPTLAQRCQVRGGAPPIAAEEVDRMMARLSRMAAVVSAIGVCAVVTTSTPAGAIGPTDFSMSPTSGPGGTVVTIAGAGCAPGLLLSGSLDRVVVTMASAPPASVQIAVTSNGAWSGTLTVPANAAAAPAVVTAVCFTDGLQSLLTIYTPKTFTVTSAAAPSTTTPGTQAPTTTVPEPTHQPPATHPPGHGSGSTPTSKPGGPRTTHPDGGGPVAGVPGGPGAGSSDPGGANNGGESSGAGKTASGKRADTVGVAADLRAPDLTSTGAGDGGSGLGWIGRLALVLLIAGAIAGALLFRRYRYGSTPNEA